MWLCFTIGSGAQTNDSLQVMHLCQAQGLEENEEWWVGTRTGPS